MNQRVVVHLNGGGSCAGKISEVSEEDSDRIKEALKDLMSSGPNEGWQINIESTNGSWAAFPRSSVQYIEIEVRPDGN